MFSRYCFRALGLMCLVLPIAGCTNTQVNSISVAPTAQTLAVTQTVQLTATGTVSHGSHPSSTENITDQVTWTSSTPAVATVTSSGLVTAVSPGTATVSASLPGLTTASASITVTGAGGTTTGATLTSLAIIPGTQSVTSPSQTSQFIAVGTTSTGATEDLTSVVIWSSSSTQVATISSGGLATGVGQGTTTITAIYSNSNSTVVTATATFTVTGGTSEALTALTITPSTQAVSASGQQAQFIALGTSGNTGLEEDETNSVQWISSIPTVASIGAKTGLATGVSVGTSAITALYTNSDGSVVAATATVTVTATSAPEPLLSLTIIPSSITVGNLEDTGNFLAIGTFSDVPYVRDLTNTVTWLSSAPDIFPVSTDNSSTNPGAPGGVVTAFGNGSSTIIAEAMSSDFTIQTATATFNCPLVLPNPPTTAGSCFSGSQAVSLLSTLTVYNEGLNTTDWQVTAPSATGTPDVIHCGPGWSLKGGAGGSVCTASYPNGTTVVLTAPAGAGAFGGWSTTCTPLVPINAAGPNSCSITIGNVTATGTPDVNTGNSNVTVGAIFN
jgi:hypothetical protein